MLQRNGQQEKEEKEPESDNGKSEHDPLPGDPPSVGEWGEYNEETNGGNP